MLHGSGFTFSVPGGWSIRGETARSDGATVSVTRYTLLKPYDPARFAAAAKELDGVAAQLAKQAGSTLSERATLTVAGRKTRAYRYRRGDDDVRVGFVLEGTREYQLLCRLPGGTDRDGACELLFRSFALT